MVSNTKYLQNKEPFLSPWSSPRHPEILFPIEPYEYLLKDLSTLEPLKLLDYWNSNQYLSLAKDYWTKGTREDWLWGLGLPFLADVERHLNNNKRRVIAISGLPGSGKSSFGNWLEYASKELDYQISVVSLDDFYLPSDEMDQAMLGNPWGVPRGLPGSHSLELIEESIQRWIDTGTLSTPMFDKSLRNGKGDRSGWRESKPNILIFEGWFLGCDVASPRILNEARSDKINVLTPMEISYRETVQKSLIKYFPIWQKFSKLWHLKPTNFNSTIKWKTQQENNLKLERGSSLQGNALDHFLRMIGTAIPRQSLLTIKSDVIVKINSERRITWVGSNSEEASDEKNKLKNI